MRAFKDQPLARKALTLGVVPTLCALAIVCVVSMIATYVAARRNLIMDLDGQAAIIAETVSASLAFRDEAAAATILNAMKARPNIDAVCVFDASGTLFASFAQPGHACDRSTGLTPAGGSSLIRRQPVSAGTRALGTVSIAGNLDTLYAWLWTQAVVVVGALIGGLLVALALTRRIQRSVSSPVLDLAATADAISARRDYGLRAAQTTNDEVGGLVRSFNAMLDEIQQGNTALTIEVAERKHAEHLKDEFLAAVSHELRTPLNAVLGWVQILRQTEPTPERMTRALDSLERNAHSQARVIEDLLDVSRIVSGKLHVRFDVVDLRDVIAAAIDVTSTAAGAKSIAVSYVQRREPCFVNGDADRLQQVLVNVLANAVKFTSAPGRIEVTLRDEGDAGDYAVSVSDSGGGIAPEFLPHVFERFRQADGSLTRLYGGLGLGLTIVKEVTELHGGSVVAASAGVGHGATFTIRLPRMVGTAAPSPSAATTLPEPTADRLNGLRVLVVDDDRDSREIAATTLQRIGASVTAVSSGNEAIAAWTNGGGYGVLVCDLAMPDVDGFSVLEQIRALDARAQRTTVAIAVTAHASNEFKQRTLTAGFRAHVTKPYDTSELVVVVLTALRGLQTQSTPTET